MQVNARLSIRPRVLLSIGAWYVVLAAGSSAACMVIGGGMLSFIQPAQRFGARGSEPILHPALWGLSRHCALACPKHKALEFVLLCFGNNVSVVWHLRARAFVGDGGGSVYRVDTRTLMIIAGA